MSHYTHTAPLSRAVPARALPERIAIAIFRSDLSICPHPPSDISKTSRRRKRCLSYLPGKNATLLPHHLTSGCGLTVYMVRWGLVLDGASLYEGRILIAMLCMCVFRNIGARLPVCTYS